MDKQALIFDLYEVAEALYVRLVKNHDKLQQSPWSHGISNQKSAPPQEDDEVGRLKELEKLAISLFLWLKKYYICDLQRHMPKPIPGGHVLAESLYIKSTDLTSNDLKIYQTISDTIEMMLNEQLADIFPGKTWRYVDVKHGGPFEVVWMVGDDYRTRWFMENLYDEKTGRMKPVAVEAINGIVVKDNELANTKTITIDLKQVDLDNLSVIQV